MKKLINVAMVGATGLVGAEVIRLLEEREFPVKNLYLFASDNSAGERIDFNSKSIVVEVLKKDSFKNKDIQIAFFSAGGNVSKTFVPLAVAEGVVVIDNTSHFRMAADVPLVVPEINPEDIPLHKGIIANPNCSTIQMVMALYPIYKAVGIRRIVVTTFQSVSGVGRRAVNELSEQTMSLFNQSEVKPEVFPYQIAFNCIPHIGDFEKNGYSQEEMKMIHETRKILHDPEIRISATTVRVPVFCGHCESVNIETLEKISPKEIVELLQGFPGVTVIDDPASNIYPTPLMAVEQNEVFVGRIRQDDSQKNGIDMWVVADNIRKGAALNAIQIGELMLSDF